MFRILIRFLIEAAVDTVGYNDSFSSVQLQVRSYLPNVHNLSRISEKKKRYRGTWAQNLEYFVIYAGVRRSTGNRDCYLFIYGPENFRFRSL